jgi:hypothetical protein
VDAGESKQRGWLPLDVAKREKERQTVTAGHCSATLRGTGAWNTRVSASLRLMSCYVLL